MTSQHGDDDAQHQRCCCEHTGWPKLNGASCDVIRVDGYDLYTIRTMDYSYHVWTICTIDYFDNICCVIKSEKARSNHLVIIISGIQSQKHPIFKQQ